MNEFTFSNSYWEKYKLRVYLIITTKSRNWLFFFSQNCNINLLLQGKKSELQEIATCNSNWTSTYFLLQLGLHALLSKTEVAYRFPEQLPLVSLGVLVHANFCSSQTFSTLSEASFVFYRVNWVHPCWSSTRSAALYSALRCMLGCGGEMASLWSIRQEACTFVSF